LDYLQEKNAHKETDFEKKKRAKRSNITPTMKEVDNPAAYS
jgi:hypothetical protein